MSTDRTVDAAAQDHGGLRQMFEEKAQVQTDAPADQTLAATARAEIAATERAETALEEHDQDWVRQRDALAGKPDGAPTLDYGVQPARSIQSEYQEARTRWEMRQDQILDAHQAERAGIRARGQTLSDTFGMTNSVADHQPAVERPELPDAGNSAAPEATQSQSAGGRSFMPRQRSTGRSR